MTKAAVEAVGHVFREGFKYSKAEVLLLGLCQKGEYTDDLFAASQPVATERVMGVLDAINCRWGRGTVRLASVPTDPDWGGDAAGDDEPELHDQGGSAVDGLVSLTHWMQPLALPGSLPGSRACLLPGLDAQVHILCTYLSPARHGRAEPLDRVHR